MQEVPTLARLLRSLQQVPYLASKNLYRVATHFLQMDERATEQFCALLVDAKKNVVPCKACFYWQQKGSDCIFCGNAKRVQSVVCVVENWFEVMSIERTQAYDGVYHVLGGAICPLEGVGPEDLTIDQLIARVGGGVKELILATSQTPEGEATAAFIASKLKDVEVTISCLARGMPVGSSISAMDRVTVYKALSERRPF